MSEDNTDAVMKRCQVGTRNYNDANNLHSDCYAVIGRLKTERDRYKREADCNYMHDPEILCTKCGWFREARHWSNPNDC